MGVIFDLKIERMVTDDLKQQVRWKASDAKEIFVVSVGMLLETPETLRALERSELGP